MRHPRLGPTTGLALLALVSACSESPVQPPLQTPTTPSSLVSVPLARVSRVDLGTLGGAHSYATDVNDAGIVVGWSETATGMDRAFRWTPSRGMIDLGTLAGDEWSRAISITSTGQILGVSGRAEDFSGTPVLWTAPDSARPLPIPLLPGATSMLLADRNGTGQVVGSGFGGTLFSHAFTWSRARGIYDITANIPGGAYESYGSGANTAGVVVGTNHAFACTHTTECWRAFVWNEGSGYRDLGIPGSDSGAAQVTGSALNDWGVVVGWTSPSPANGTHPYKWTERAGFTLLPTFSPTPGIYGYAQSVNLSGTAVGASLDAQLDAIQAAAWPGAGGIVRLSPGDPNPSVAVAVNAVGGVAGWSSLDCCGAANHATLWRLGPGRGVTTATVAEHTPPQPLRAGPTGSQSARSGAVSCLADPQAVASRQLLMNCVVTRRD